MIPVDVETGYHSFEVVRAWHSHFKCVLFTPSSLHKNKSAFIFASYYVLLN
jgi:hypothetical protein